MNTFINAIQNKTFTENGALTHISSGSGILDLFFHGAAIRKTRPEAIIELFNKAFEEDPNLALKTLFYIRDIRGGQGERKVFRLALKNFMENHSEWFTEENIKLIPEYGRFDDLFCLIEDKTLYDQHIRNIYQVINEQFLTDLENLKNNNLTHISLLAKWMPSINASSKETKKLGKLLCNYVSEGNEKQYRQSLSALRKALNILETKMSNKEYDLIDYSKIPSLAAIKYIKAF